MESWGIYVQQSTGIFIIYSEAGFGTENGTQVDSCYFWYSIDKGLSWRLGSAIPTITSMYMTSGDVEGDGDAIYIQSTEMGMFRSTDLGQNWKSIGGPSNAPDTRFFVLPSCNGGTVLAFDDSGGVWLTIDGGDGQVKNPTPSVILSSDMQLTSACGRTRFPIFLHGPSLDSIEVQPSVSKDSLHEFLLEDSSSVLLKSGVNDTMWVDYSPKVSPDSSTLTLNFQNNSHCSDWTESRTVAVIAPPSAKARVPQPINAACNIINDTGFVSIDSCQSLVITNVIINPSISKRLLFQYALPDTVLTGFHNALPFQFNPLDTVINGAVNVELRGYYIGTTISFDTILDVQISSAMPKLEPNFTSIDFSSVTTCMRLRDTVLTFVNAGCAPDTIISMTIAGAGIPQFYGPSNSLSLVINPNDSEEFEYQYIPSFPGPSAPAVIQLEITSNGILENVSIPLSGTGIQDSEMLSIASPSVTAPTISICGGNNVNVFFDTITNIGCDTLAVSGGYSYEHDGTFGLNFPDSNIWILPPDSSEVLEFGFDPLQKGVHTDSIGLTLITLDHIGVNAPRDTVIALHGIAIGSSTLEANTALRDFGALYECQSRDTTITLSNTGCDTLSIDSGFVSNGTYTTNAVYPIILPPDSSATVQVSLAADSAGMNGTIEFFSNANQGSGTVTIPVTASIISPARLVLDLSPSDTATDGDTVRCYVLLEGNVPNGAISSFQFDITHNDDLLTYENASGVTKTGSAGTAQLQTLQFSVPVGSRSGSPTYADTLGMIKFLVYLSDSSSTPLALSNVTFTNTLSLAPDCIASILDSSASFTYLYKCGEPIIQDAMLGVPFSITGIVPNPAQNEITIQVAAVGDHHAITCEMYDALGRGQDVHSTSLPSAITLDVSNVPSGIYFLRISSGGYVESRSVVIEH